MRLTRVAYVIVAVALAGCAVAQPSQTTSQATATSAMPSSSPPATPTASPDARTPAQEDLGRLLTQLERIHPEPFHGISREEFVEELQSLESRIGDLSPEEATVELMRITALLSREGRDGHQFLVPLAAAEGTVLPIRVFEFEEGMYVTAALPPHEGLAGARITAIGGHPIDDVLAAVEPLVPRDGPATVPGFRPIFLLRTMVLRGLGLTGDGPVEITVESAAGSRTVALEPVAFDVFQEWIGGHMTRLPERAGIAFLLNADDHFWTEYRPASRTLYVRFGAVGGIESDEITAFEQRAAEPDVDRVVVDLRHNPGGDNGAYPLLLAALQGDAVDRPGRLFVITDRLTFSAASNFATEVEQTTDAIFVGEPMGGGLNFWNDVQWVYLDGLPIPSRFGISTRYWQFSIPDDPRLTIEPDIPVPVRAADYFAGTDAALEAAERQSPP